ACGRRRDGTWIRPRPERPLPLLQALRVRAPGHERERVQHLGADRLVAQRPDRDARHVPRRRPRALGRGAALRARSGGGAVEARLLLLGSAVTSLLGYALLTRMHERYVFTSVVLFAPLVFARPFRWVYGLLSVTLLLNLWYAFAYYNSQIPVQALRWEP